PVDHPAVGSVVSCSDGHLRLEATGPGVDDLVLGRAVVLSRAGGRLVGRLVRGLVGRLVRRLVGRLVRGLVGGLVGGCTVTVGDHVGRGVEGLGAVGTLPDHVDDVLPTLLGQGHIPVVLCPGVTLAAQRRVDDLVDELQVVPGQRFRHIETVDGDVGEETTGMRSPGIVPELHGLPGRQIGGGPVGACLVEAGEVVGGSTQLPVGHELTVLPVRVGDEIAVPVPEGVVTALVKGVDAGRVGGVQRTTAGTAGGVVETRIGAAGRVGEGTVCLSRGGGGEHRVPGEEGSGAHQGRDECSLSCPFHLVLPHAGVGRAGRVLLHPAGQGCGTNRV